MKKQPTPIRGLNILAAVTVIVALWVALPRVACAELHATARDLRSKVALSVGHESGTATALRTLQPRLTAKGARLFATEIDAAAKETDLDPRLIVAIGFRESSFLRPVVLGHRRGSRGETGVMQVHGYGLRFAKGCSQRDPGCSIRTGSRFLAHIRDKGCPGSTWRWVAGYGRRSCPTEDQAKVDKSAIRARALYCLVRSDCAARWPDPG